MLGPCIIFTREQTLLKRPQTNDLQSVQVTEDQKQKLKVLHETYG